MPLIARHLVCCIIGLLLAPFLLAPVYYQGGTAPTLQQQQEPTDLTALPAAAPLASPLLVTPTLEESSPTEAPAKAPSDAPETAPDTTPAAKGVMDAKACVYGLGVMQDMAALAYQHDPRKTYMGVLVAAGLARQQVLDGELPNLEVLRKRLHAIAWGGTLRDQLLQAYVLLEVPCTPVKGAGKVKQGPTVDRPR